MVKTKDLYFIQCDDDGPIKIGISNSAGVRLKDIQQYCPHKLKIIKMVRNGEYLERKIHKIFSNLRLRGEWFKPERELIEYINNLNLRVPPRRKMTNKEITKQSIKNARIQTVADEAIEKYEKAIVKDIKKTNCMSIVRKWHIGINEYWRLKNKYGIR